MLKSALERLVLILHVRLSLAGTFKPTPAHYFIRLLQDRGMLLRCYTQNVDTLERQAGLSPDVLVEAHGSFADSSCIDCRVGQPNEYHLIRFRSSTGRQAGWWRYTGPSPTCPASTAS